MMPSKIRIPGQKWNIHQSQTLNRGGFCRYAVDFNGNQLRSGKRTAKKTINRIIW